ncbi:probable serine/threonine-protein kinase kinX [Amyelois transitella]|uniref:probable serine/threonine-protein kinase kinX n=1 Tax=Amyelois transitella TaxID=680683 RepID=UPI00067D5297|nr:probable serine/threonine-protein kinase kinX [Amyelois transitella]
MYIKLVGSSHPYRRKQALLSLTRLHTPTAMYSKITFTFTTLLFLAAKGSRDDPGPQTFAASQQEPLPSSPPPLLQSSPQHQFETREVIVYLTPTQIRALQSGQGVLEPILEPQPHQEVQQQNPKLTQLPQNYYDNDEEFRKELERQKAYIETHPNIAEAISAIQKQKNNTPPPVREPSREEPQEESAQLQWNPDTNNQYYDPATLQIPTSDKPESNQYQIPSTEKPESNKYLALTPENQENLLPNSYNYFSIYNEKKGDNINIKIIHPAPADKQRNELEGKSTQKPAPIIKNYKLIPYEYLNTKQSGWRPIIDPNQSRVTQKNTERQLGALFTPAQPEEQQQLQKSDQAEELLRLKYASKFNDHKQAIEIQNLIRQQKAEAQIEAIAKSPPVEVHREVSVTKHKPVNIVKHVQVPVPQPYIVRVPEPFEVKVPQPYPVPLEIIRPVPVEVVKTEKIEVEKPVPYEVQKHVEVPVTKNVYFKVDKPFIVEKVVPVEVRKEIPVHIPIHKPQKLTILRHIWEH